MAAFRHLCQNEKKQKSKMEADDRIKEELRGIAFKLFSDLAEEGEERDRRKREMRQGNNDGQGEKKTERLHAIQPDLSRHCVGGQQHS